MLESQHALTIFAKEGKLEPHMRCNRSLSSDIETMAEGHFCLFAWPMSVFMLVRRALRDREASEPKLQRINKSSSALQRKLPSNNKKLRPERQSQGSQFLGVESQKNLARIAPVK